ncbi:hypothetical protein M407DRAFT_244347, partial [Tulasnella calospora MUT 4182]
MGRLGNGLCLLWLAPSSMASSSGIGSGSLSTGKLETTADLLPAPNVSCTNL